MATEADRHCGEDLRSCIGPAGAAGGRLMAAEFDIGLQAGIQALTNGSDRLVRMVSELTERLESVTAERDALKVERDEKAKAEALPPMPAAQVEGTLRALLIQAKALQIDVMAIVRQCGIGP